MAQLQSTLKLTLLDQVSARAKHITGALDGIHRQTNRLMAPFTGGLAQFMALAGAYVGVTEGIQGTIGAAISFESAFADLKKVIDANDEQIQGFERSIRKLSTVIPATANDLAALYASGAESGIATNELNQFAEMASRVGIAFDIPMSEAGESLAKLKTQLGLTLTETGDLADAMNFLSNSMASKASDIQAFMLRVGALAEMGGLAKEEIAAMGSAMIAAGAEPETAATAMQNVVKAMTRGTSAKKAQKDVAKALGLNLPQLAKEMQKDAPKAIKKVLAAIAKQPKDRHIALLSDFFGDEAKAFAPLVGDIKLLDDALSSVADRSKYAGSAFKEYVARAATTGNVLQILQNKFAELGRSIGDDWLPTVKGAALGIGEVLDSLGERAHIFDQIGAGFQGFANGLGFKTSAQEAVEALGDLLLGPADGSASADKLGRIFARFQQFGQQAKAFGEDVGAAVDRLERAFNLKPGALGDTLSTIAGYGAGLGAASIGIGLAAGAISALGRAFWVLSGGALVVGGAKGLARLFGAVASFSGVPGFDLDGKSKANTPGKTPDIPAAGWFGRMGTWMKGLGVMSLIPASAQMLQDTPGDSFEEQVAIQAKRQDDLRRLFGLQPYAVANSPATVQAEQDAGRRTQMGVAQQVAIQGAQFPGKAKDDFDIGRSKTVAIDAASISAMIQPSGTQSVRVENQQIPNVTVTNSFTITGVADPQAAASSAASKIGAEVKRAVASADTD